MQKPKSLRDLLLAHELIFVLLILLSVAGGVFGIHLWDKSAKESQRIHFLVQEIQQTRGDLYRQMKELFDAFFLNDQDAKNEYKTYTESILKHFDKLDALAVGAEEVQAVKELENNYKLFANDAPDMFYRYQASPNEKSRKALYQDMETGIFTRYEAVSKHAEDLLLIKQNELKMRLNEAKRASMAILIIPILLAGLLLTLSRFFLKRSIINPINAIMQATSEISAGNLQHKVPETGAQELATLSHEINKMADDLQTSRDALVRSEKQAAMGLLVPMLAHNIRNPLASIRATAQIIEVKKNDKETRESLDGIINI
jgi:HAMP domain-containing protein